MRRALIAPRAGTTLENDRTRYAAVGVVFVYVGDSVSVRTNDDELEMVSCFPKIIRPFPRHRQRQLQGGL
jgi:hypothetical protein